MEPARAGKTVPAVSSGSGYDRKELRSEKIIFITIESPIYNNIGLEQLFTYAKEATEGNHKEGWTIIFDEIQYCRNWEVHLKSLVDSYRKDKFVASGSAAAALKFAGTESGAGRFTGFMLPPLCFNKYISLKGLDRIIIPTHIKWKNNISEFYTSSHLNELNRHFIDYINFRGYPEVIFSQKTRKIRGDISVRIL